jgi:hypothetical protein
VHDTHLSASNPHKHLIIAMSLWMVSLLCKLVTPMTLALWLHVAAFAIPKTYMLLKAKVRSLRVRADGGGGAAPPPAACRGALLAASPS